MRNIRVIGRNMEVIVELEQGFKIKILPDGMPQEEISKPVWYVGVVHPDNGYEAEFKSVAYPTFGKAVAAFFDTLDVYTHSGSITKEQIESANNLIVNLSSANNGVIYYG